MAYDKNDLKRRMDGAMEQLKTEFTGLRTGRAATSMLETVQVEAYGSHMPISQCGSVSVPEPRMLTVTVWDATISKNVEKAIRESGLGLNPQAEGNVIRVPVPQLNEERRKELTKVAGKYAEGARVAVRNIRRDGMDGIKAMKGEVSEDDQKRLSDEVQKLTDGYIAQIDKMLVDKEKDIMTV
ncbi:ribosome recycling factor [Micavibrio aeruginosavorus]|uniref:Ribosome-recycling factor n=1 Tax=Micavibrio aeruginosavorus (strain ARL-13) TaxID=856793 RepID=G2KSQ8_MICAA|nr:ribosome recycling factor [Micavibrio aeruginosavorus]AEP09658.1 ribosome recycling factor [Micavibrio aeruginosavorus ARL-13]